MIERFTRFVGRRRWALAGAWVVLLAVAGVVGSPLPSLLSGGGWSVAGSDTQIVAERIQDGFVGRGPSDVTVVVHDEWYDASQPGFGPRVSQVFEEVAAHPDLEVESQVGYATSPASGAAGQSELRDQFVGDDGRTAITTFGMALEDGKARMLLAGVQEELDETYADQGLDVSLVGSATFWGEVNHLSEQGLMRAELLTLPLILLVLVVIFRGVVAALVSLAVGVTAILASFAVLALVAGHYELNIFVQNTATMLGLGVGVDYSLVVVSRFKEELAKGASVDEAIATTLRTSGETVLFSGITIVAAMSTLFLVPLGVIGSIALGAVVVVGFSVLSALLVLPVILRLVGRRISVGSVRLRRGARAVTGAHKAEVENRWERLSRRVMRRPVVFLTLGTTALLALAVPAAGLTTFTPDAQIVPTSSPVRQGFDRMQEQFGAGTTAPVRVLLEADRPLTEAADSAAVTALIEDLSGLDHVATVDSALPLLTAAAPESPLSVLDPAAREQLPAGVRAVVGHYVSADAQRIVLDVVPEGRASDPSTRTLLDDVRSEVAGSVAADLAGVDVKVGGETADGVASNTLIRDSLPLVVGVMLAVIYVLLLVTFRSVLLPLKAIAMNLVSVAATFGVLVLVFQQGFGVELLGVEGPADIQNFLPVLLLALLFSLSTDYEVFLLNRVREHYKASGDNTESVVVGMSSTAPLISGAALLMVVVFGSFALAGILPMKQMGFGMAVAIALDATIVRMLLVPASMRLMGRWNWWLPSFRRRPAAWTPRQAPSAGPRRTPAPRDLAPANPPRPRELEPAAR